MMVSDSSAQDCAETKEGGLGSQEEAGAATVDSSATGAASAASGLAEAGADQPECRICRLPADDEDDELGKLCAPCKCDGSIRYVHQACLEQWLRVQRTEFSTPRCELCGHQFEFQNRYKAGTPERLACWEVAAALGGKAVTLAPTLLWCCALVGLWLFLVPVSLSNSFSYLFFHIFQLREGMADRTGPYFLSTEIRLYSAEHMLIDFEVGMFLAVLAFATMLALFAFLDFYRVHAAERAAAVLHARPAAPHLAPHAAVGVPAPHGAAVGAHREHGDAVAAQAEEVVVQAGDPPVAVMADVPANAHPNVMEHFGPLDRGDFVDDFLEGDDDMVMEVHVPVADVVGFFDGPIIALRNSLCFVVLVVLWQTLLLLAPLSGGGALLRTITSATGGVHGDVHTHDAAVCSDVQQLVGNLVYNSSSDGIAQAWVERRETLLQALHSSADDAWPDHLLQRQVRFCNASMCVDACLTSAPVLVSICPSGPIRYIMGDAVKLAIGYACSVGMVLLLLYLLRTVLRMTYDPARDPLNGEMVLDYVEDYLDLIASVSKIASLITLKMVMFPIGVGVLLRLSLIGVVGNAEDSATLLRDTVEHPVTLGIGIHWLIGITYMLLTTMIVLDIRCFVHPAVLDGLVHIPDEHNLLVSLLEEPFVQHFRRIFASILIYSVFVAVFVWLPPHALRMLIPSLHGCVFPLRFPVSYFWFTGQAIAEQVAAHFFVLGSIDHFKDHLRAVLESGVRSWSAVLGLEGYMIPTAVSAERERAAPVTPVTCAGADGGEHKVPGSDDEMDDAQAPGTDDRENLVQQRPWQPWEPANGPTDAGQRFGYLRSDGGYRRFQLAAQDQPPWRRCRLGVFVLGAWLVTVLCGWSLFLVTAYLTTIPARCFKLPAVLCHSPCLFALFAGSMLMCIDRATGLLQNREPRPAAQQIPRLPLSVAATLVVIELVVILTQLPELVALISTGVQVFIRDVGNEQYDAEAPSHLAGLWTFGLWLCLHPDGLDTLHMLMCQGHSWHARLAYLSRRLLIMTAAVFCARQLIVAQFVTEWLASTISALLAAVTGIYWVLPYGRACWRWFTQQQHAWHDILRDERYCVGRQLVDRQVAST